MLRLTTRLLAAAAALLAPAALQAQAAPAIGFNAGGPHGPVYYNVAPMNRTIEERLTPQLRALLRQLVAEGRGMRLSGVAVFESGDKFLPGKIASGLSYLVLDESAAPAERAANLAAFRDIADLTLEEVNESWGLYYYISALYNLHKAGLLDEAVRPETLARLRTKLDWRTFVREDTLELIDLPNNYYGVAFSIARLRMLLGWEDARASEQLLARTLNHYRTYSGAYGFADETAGEGRFDRYSVLLIGEIAQRLVETGMEPSAEVRTWLRNSVDLMLPRFNLTGEGWEYGRSIGAYGETAFLEVLTAAAQLDLLTREEEEMAYAFSSRIAARYVDFWISPATGSVNLWDGGRRTDAYRARHRILGENLSLGRQHIYTNALWNARGFRDRAPSPRYAAWLGRLPASTTTMFARGDYDRGVVTIRDRGHVIGLPLINGGAGQHMNNPYFPVPHAAGMLSGAADAAYPHLVPRFTLADGSVLMPLAWFRDIDVRRRGEATTVTYRQTEMDRMGGNAPAKDGRLHVETRYEFTPGRIVRRDRYTPTGPLSVRDVALEFGSFSYEGAMAGASAARFAKGEVTDFAVEGLGSCTIEPAAAPYQAPSGPLRTVVRCASGAAELSRPFEISWTIKYL